MLRFRNICVGIALGTAISAPFFNSHISLSGSIYEPPNPSPPPIDDKNFELVFVQVVTRHGLRTPMSISFNDTTGKHGKWECNPFVMVPPSGKENGEHPSHLFSKTYVLDEEERSLPGNCNLGQLTALGERGMQTVGEKLREYYVDKLHFLSSGGEGEEKTKEELFLRSTDTSRTLLSAQHLLAGLFPTSLHGTVRIHVLDRAGEDMYPRSTCERFQQLVAAHKKLQKAKEASDGDVFERRSKIKKAVSYNVTSWPGTYNSLYTRDAHNLKQPSGVTQETLLHAARESNRDYLNKFEKKEAVRLGIGRFVHDLTFLMELKRDVHSGSTGWSWGWAGQKLRKTAVPEEWLTKSTSDWKSCLSNLKFALYSGHDNTLGPLLAGFGVFDEMKKAGINPENVHDTPPHPPMSSSVILELYSEVVGENGKGKAAEDNYWVRLVYNGKPMVMRGSQGRVLCPMKDFLAMAKEITPLDYKAECMVPK